MQFSLSQLVVLLSTACLLIHSLTQQIHLYIHSRDSYYVPTICQLLYVDITMSITIFFEVPTLISISKVMLSAMKEE